MPRVSSTADDAKTPPHGSTHPLLYRIPDAVRTTGLCRSKIYELINAGELRVLHFGRAIRITEQSLRELIARRTEPARQRPAQSETKKLLNKAVARACHKSACAKRDTRPAQSDAGRSGRLPERRRATAAPLTR
jgi:excisionase family DNA binding protein